MRKRSKVGLTPRGAQSCKKDYLQRKKAPTVERKSNPMQVGPKISMIGAAAMDKHLREGVPAYFLHISVLKDINHTPETLKATNLEPSNDEGAGRKDKGEGDAQREVTEAEKEVMRQKEREELEKHVPVQYWTIWMCSRPARPENFYHPTGLTILGLTWKLMLCPTLVNFIICLVPS